MTPDGERSERWGTGKRYRVRWVEAGTRRGRSFATSKAATRWWHQVAVADETIGPAPVSDITVDELTMLWLDTKRHLSVRGYEACEYAAAAVDQEWKDVLAVDITASGAAAWVAGLSGSASRRGKILQSFRGALALGVADGLLERNPAEGLKVRAGQPREARFLQLDELRHLAWEAGQPHSSATGGRGPGVGRHEPDTAMVWLLGTTGLRIGEAQALDVGDIDERRRRLRVRTSKNGTARDVPIPPQVLAVLPLAPPPGGRAVHVAAGAPDRGPQLALPGVLPGARHGRPSGGAASRSATHRSEPGNRVGR